MKEIQDYRSFRMRCLATTLGIVYECKPPPNVIVSVRLKRLDSIRRKLNRASANFKLGGLDDVIGVRVICQSLLDVRDFSSRIEKIPQSRLKDYVDNPAVTGYRGVHGILAFPQPAGAGIELRARFEVQVRTYYQHRWAVWSESHGEAVKVGAGNSDEHRRLFQISERIAQWEIDNPDVIQTNLPQSVGARSIAVCWKPEHGPARLDFFDEDVKAAIDWLQYLEEKHTERRREALLLVGLAEHSERKSLIQLTHPLYTGVRVIDPNYWMPDRTPD
ncbi:MAG: RelA/SpoT domain-containing protein [Rhodobacteraceae bacterium]|nr:RelA/SpoT domain-containing protein [Paracoccaceae bacterium]